MKNKTLKGLRRQLQSISEIDVIKSSRRVISEAVWLKRSFIGREFHVLVRNVLFFDDLFWLEIIHQGAMGSDVNISRRKAAGEKYNGYFIAGDSDRGRDLVDYLGSTEVLDAEYVSHILKTRSIIHTTDPQSIIRYMERLIERMEAFLTHDKIPLTENARLDDFVPSFGRFKMLFPKARELSFEMTVLTVMTIMAAVSLDPSWIISALLFILLFNLLNLKARYIRFSVNLSDKVESSFFP